MVDVFISYPRAERERVEPIKAKLEALDLDVFFDLDGIDSSAAFPSIIDRALKASKAVLCCWSPLYFTRDWCLTECRYAAPRGRLVAARMEAFDAEAPPADLMLYSFYDLADWRGEDAHEGWNRTLRDLGQKTGRDLAPALSRSAFGGLSAGPAPEPPAPAAAKADLLEDLRRTWERFASREDLAMVERLLERVRAAAPGSGLEFEIEHHLDQLQRAEAARREEQARRRAAEEARQAAERAEAAARARAEEEARREAERVAREAAERDRTLSSSPAGTVFRDRLSSGEECPELCVIPAGRFLMGTPADKPQREPWKSGVESPQHEVRIGRPFALGRYAVTFDEYDAFCAATRAERPDDQGWGRGRRPAIKVSWKDAEAYCGWLSEQTGATYRLPSEAEWEYACRAGTTTPFWWGREITPEQANYNGTYAYAGGGAKGVDRGKTEPVDAFTPNPWGLYQTHGNVWEWCQDCWNKSYQGAPADGSPWMTGDCSLAVRRGGSWLNPPRGLRSASRYRNPRESRDGSIGFRLARTLRE